ncbi:hypothetical protein FDECE_18389, partial [Fusarium decemcellulare]
MASTAVPRQNPALRRTVTSNTVTDSESSAAVSPSDSPRHSASSTSLSSLSEVDIEKPKATSYGRLIDTYGNEFEVPDFTIKDIHNAIPKHCFQRSALRGYGYILRDMVLLATTFSIYYNFVTPE